MAMFDESKVPPVDDKLKELLEKARAYREQNPVTPEELEQQAISFAYGNVRMHNPAITRGMVEIEAAALKAMSEWTAETVKLAEDAGFGDRSRQVAEVARAVVLKELGALGTWVRDGKDYDFRNDAKDSIARAIENRVRFLAIGMLSYGETDKLQQYQIKQAVRRDG